MKLLYLLIFPGFTSVYGLAQKSFSVSLHIDSSIDSRYIQITYDNGRGKEYRPDLEASFIKGTMLIQGQYYGRKLDYAVQYDPPNDQYGSYSHNFFVEDKPAKIGLTFRPGSMYALDTTQCKNASYILSEPGHQRYLEFQRDVMAQFKDFWAGPGKEGVINDILGVQLGSIQRQWDENLLPFAASNPEDYYTFWRFKQEILNYVERYDPGPGGYERAATFYRNTFPSGIRNSIEGQSLEQQLEYAANPFKAGDFAPKFDAVQFDGKPFSFEGHSDRYVLLCFWATWCTPCIQEIPELHKLRESIPDSKLQMISVCTQSDSAKAVKAILENNIRWMNLKDEGKSISNRYFVSAIPQLYLIDKEGVIRYATTGAVDLAEIRRIVTARKAK